MQKLNEVLLAIVICCVAAVAQTAPQVPSDKLTSVSGTVTNSLSGSTILRAHVVITTLADPSAQTYGALTNAEGNFSIRQVPPGEYSITVEKLGFQDLRNSNFFTLDAGQKKDSIKLVLVPSGSITGRVLDADGEPVEGASVVVPEGAGGMTDDQGQFRIGGLRPGHYTVSATVRATARTSPETRTDGSLEPNYASTYYPGVVQEKGAGRVNVGAGTETSGIEIRLIRTPVLRISGRVIGLPEGQPARGWYVQIGTRNRRMNGGLVKEDGTFDIWRISPGRYQVAAAQNGDMNRSQTAAVNVEVTASNVEGIELRAVAPFALSGVVQYDDAAAQPQDQGPARGGTQNRQSVPAPPRRPERIFLQQIGSITFGRTFTADLKADGTFSLQAVPPGHYLVRPNWTAYVKSMQLGSRRIDGNVVDLSNGESEVLSLNLSSAVAEISGVVRKGADPAGGEPVALVHVPPDGSRLNSQTSRTDGTFKFVNVVPGTYKLLTLDKDEPANSWFRKDADDFDDGVEIRVMPGDKLSRDLKAWRPEDQ